MARTVLLHLTDLHRGQAGDGGRWPQARDAFLEDLTDLRASHGAPHVLVFTGDLTFRGTDDEFGLVDETLADIARVLGASPIIVPVPGNHDLARPAGDAEGVRGQLQRAAVGQARAVGRRLPQRQQVGHGVEGRARAHVESSLAESGGYFGY